MPDINPFSLPGNFHEKVNSKLLTAPRAQFVYAHGLLGALMKSLDVGDLSGSFAGTGHNGAGAVIAGAPVGSLENDALKLYNGTLSQIFETPLDETFVGMPGTTVRFNRPAYDSTTYTWASRTVGPTQAISTTPIGVKAEQASLTLQLLTGPYDSANNCVAPYGLDKFSAQVGVNKVTDYTGEMLKYDFHRVLEAGATALLDLGTAVYPAGMTADNDITTVNGGALSVEQIARAQKIMDNANLPTFADGYRLLVIPPDGAYHLSGDSQFRDAKYFQEMNIVYRTYVGSIRGFHIITSTTLTATNNSSSVPVYKAHAVAPGVLGVASGIPPQVAFSNDTNFGLTGKVMWQACMALGLLNNAYAYTLRFG